MSAFMGIAYFVTRLTARRTIHVGCIAMCGVVTGCSGHQYIDDSSTCEVSHAADADDNSLGFTGADVMKKVQSSLPSSIVWDEISLAQAASELTLSVAALGKDLFIVESPRCTDGTVLRVPLEVAIAIDQGEVVGSGTLWIDAADADSSDSIALLPTKDLPVELSGEFETAFDTLLDERGDGRDYTIYFVGDESWTRAEVDIEVDYEGTGIEALWRGHWEL